MKKLFAISTLAACMVTPILALAQEAIAPAPPSTLPSTNTRNASYFPALPPSKPCTVGDVVGNWKLVQVFEEPQGAASAAFSYEPYQYLSMTAEQTYKSYKNMRAENEPVVLSLLQRTEEDGLKQYVIGDSGVVYFYDEGVVMDTQVCFIVSNPRGQFTVGQMLIMPPAPADGNVPSVRLAKVYTRIGTAAVQPSDGTKKNKNVAKSKKNKNDKKGKKNKKRSRR
jgi:hypothetical protein